MYPHLKHQEQQPYQKSSSASAPLFYQETQETTLHAHVHPENDFNGIGLVDTSGYDASSATPKTTFVVYVGSVLLFIGTVIVTLFLLADLIGGSVYYGGNSTPASPHNAVSVSFVKFPMLAMNAILFIMSGIFGLLSISKKSLKTVRYSLLYVIFLSLGMLFFVWEIAFIYVSFFTTGYTFETHSYGATFIPFLVIFTIFSCIGFICCGVCCISGIVRYRNLDANIKEVSV